MIKCVMDDWETCYDGSGFSLELTCIPKVGEMLHIHRSLMNPRFFAEPAYIENPVKINGDMVEALVVIVEHHFTPEGHEVHIAIDL